ncbi:MAG: VanZ family protein [Verrucomicrobiota bacterium]|nr:VanZ family protein [Verrucomicrobiota bacterium]
MAFVLAAFFAVSDEFHQSFVPSRGAAAADVGFDSAGALLGVIAFACWHALRRHGSADQ